MLKQLLDTLFEQKDLKSWTTHENKVGTVLTLRFGSIETATRDTPEHSHNVPKVRTYKQKSAYQLNRDRQRMETFSNNRKTRSQTNSDTDHVELRRGDVDLSPYSNPGLSPVRLSSEVSESDETSVEDNSQGLAEEELDTISNCEHSEPY